MDGAFSTTDEHRGARIGARRKNAALPAVSTHESVDAKVFEKKTCDRDRQMNGPGFAIFGSRGLASGSKLSSGETSCVSIIAHYNLGMPTIEEILAAVRQLPGADRGRLIPLIWDEVSPDDWASPSAPWVTEVLRRSAEIDQGKMPTAGWDVVRQRARKAAGLDG